MLSLEDPPGLLAALSASLNTSVQSITISTARSPPQPPPPPAPSIPAISSPSLPRAQHEQTAHPKVRGLAANVVDACIATAAGGATSENAQALEAAVLYLFAECDSSDTASRALHDACATEHLVRALAALISAESDPRAHAGDTPLSHTPIRVYDTVMSILFTIASSPHGEAAFALPGAAAVAAVISTAHMALHQRPVPSAMHGFAPNVVNSCLSMLSTFADGEVMTPFVLDAGRDVLVLLGAALRTCAWSPCPFAESPGRSAILVLAATILHAPTSCQAQVDVLCREFAADSVLMCGLARVLSLGPGNVGTDIFRMVCRCIFIMARSFVAHPAKDLGTIIDVQTEAMEVWLRAGLFTLLPKVVSEISDNVTVFCVLGTVQFAIHVKKTEGKAGGKGTRRLGEIALRELSVAGAQDILEGIGPSDLSATGVVHVKSMITKLAAVRSTRL